MTLKKVLIYKIIQRSMGNLATKSVKHAEKFAPPLRRSVVERLKQIEHSSISKDMSERLIYDQLIAAQKKAIETGSVSSLEECQVIVHQLIKQIRINELVALEEAEITSLTVEDGLEERVSDSLGSPHEVTGGSASQSNLRIQNSISTTSAETKK